MRKRGTLIGSANRTFSWFEFPRTVSNDFMEISPATLALAGLLLAQAPGPSGPQTPTPVDLDTQMMRATFRIVGPSVQEPGKWTTGTAFLMEKPSPTLDNPKREANVCITAAHVLHEISGDVATLVVRTTNDKGAEVPIPQGVQIRSGATPTWYESNDVAAFYCGMPEHASIVHIPMNLAASDQTFTDLDLHPGDEVHVLGYPFGYASSDLGYALLHSARLASLPLTPVADVKRFIVDFPAFGGNSGGPVYLTSGVRSAHGSLTLGAVFTLLGIVVRNTTSPDGRENIGLAEVVHATWITDAMNHLPPLPASVK